MAARLVQYSSVVVGQSHNPTILNPDFLALQGIVPSGWGWVVKEAITTPPLSLVKYENDVTITVEQDKISVTDPNVENGPEGSKVAEVAARYLDILPHVSYRAVGNNFQSLVAMEDPAAYLKTRFLKDGPWITGDPALNAVGVRLLFPIKGGRFSLTLDAGAATLPDSSDLQDVLVVNANFNRTCSESTALADAVGALKSAMRDWKLYDDQLVQFCELEKSDG